MRNKSQRLKPVSDIAVAKERDAARHMGQQQRVLAEHENKLIELINYRSEYVAEKFAAELDRLTDSR